MKSIYTLAFLIALSGCATLKGVVRTIDDLGTLACELFGTDHPAEFEAHVAHVRASLPPGSSALDVNGFDPAVLCDIKEVVQPFINNLAKVQPSTAAELQQE